MLFYRKIKEKDLDPSIKFIQCPKSYTSKNFNIIDNIVTCPICGKKPKIYKKIDSIGWTHYKIQCKKPFKRDHVSVTAGDELDSAAFKVCICRWNDFCLNYNYYTEDDFCHI